jgi:hypothetical protein
MHRYNIWFGTDGDYVQLLKLDNGLWRVCTSWLIPGTQHEGY